MKSNNEKELQAPAVLSRGALPSVGGKSMGDAEWSTRQQKQRSAERGRPPGGGGYRVGSSGKPSDVLSGIVR